MKWLRLPVGLVVVAGLLGVGGRAAIGSSSDPQIDRVVFVTIDCLRADHLSSFGYPVPTTPFLDSLAERGTSFGRAYAHSATTGPSHASMFTSLYPIQHGVMTNGHVLHQRFVTLAERMNELGFVTSAWVSGNPHFGESQIAQGFSYYDQPEQIEKSSGKTKFLYRPGG